MEEVAGIKEGFELMDTGNRGKINIDELRVGLHKLDHHIPDADLQILMEAVSSNLSLHYVLSLIFGLEGLKMCHHEFIDASSFLMSV